MQVVAERGLSESQCVCVCVHVCACARARVCVVQEGKVLQY